MPFAGSKKGGMIVLLLRGRALEEAEQRLTYSLNKEPLCTALQEEYINLVSFSPEGGAIATVGQDSTAKLWAVEPLEWSVIKRLSTGGRLPQN
jgi:WD40 repeat protein